MAATYGRLTGKPGVCMTTLGPGALNLTTGAAYALLGAMPMIMITGQKGIMSSRQAEFPDRRRGQRLQTADQDVTADRQHQRRIPTLVRDAFRIAMEERPGPVLLELPEDIAGEEAEPVAMVPQHPIEIPVAHRASLDRAAEMILEGEAATDHARRRRIAAAEHGGNRRIRPPHENSVLHDADGEGNGTRRQQPLYGNGCAQRTRLRA